jgi:hypothetical protein
MSRELLLGRRLIEAAADPYALPSDSEYASNELALFAHRFDEPVRTRYSIRIEHFDRVSFDDLSPLAWLLFIENAERNDPIVPDSILEPLYQTAADDVIRLRLVSGILGHPQIQKNFNEWYEKDFTIPYLTNLPDCWPKSRLLALDELSHTGWHRIRILLIVSKNSFSTCFKTGRRQLCR